MRASAAGNTVTKEGIDHRPGTETESWEPFREIWLTLRDVFIYVRVLNTVGTLHAGMGA